MMTTQQGWQLDAVEAAVTRISDLARNSDLAAPVPHLNRWKVRDVVAHLGGVHRWAIRIVTDRSMAGPGFKKSLLDGTALCDWFDEGANELLALLRATPLDEPCPNFNPGSAAHVEFWARRQAHEATVHRWDVEKALGSTTAIEPSLAADGIDEFLDVFVRTRGKQTLQSTLVVTSMGPDASWTLTPAAKPGRIDIDAGGTTTAGAVHTAGAVDTAGDVDTAPTGPVTEVSGSPEGLLLTLWGRCTAHEAELTIDGDIGVAASLITV